MNGFKVVAVRPYSIDKLDMKSYRLSSIVAEGTWRTFYTPEMWTYPAVGKLFAFNSIDSAFEFDTLFQDSQIWECECIYTRHTTDLSGLSVHPSMWESFWKGGLPPERRGAAVPYGTVVVDAVKLIKPVYASNAFLEAWRLRNDF